MTISKQLKTGAEVLQFIYAGKAMLTVVGAKDRFTYKIKIADDGNLHFVSVLNGPDNWSNYQYIGFIRDGQLIAGKKGHPDAASYKAFAWTLAHLVKNPEQIAEPLEVWHEGKCGRCGRKLTVPESIDQGYGPECIKIVAPNKQLGLNL